MYHPKRQASPLLNINLLDLGPALFNLGDSHHEYTILQLGTDTLAVDLLTLQLDLPLEHTNGTLALALQCLEELLVADTVDHASDVQGRRLGVPVHADVLLLGAGNGEVEGVGARRREKIERWCESLNIVLRVVVVGGGVASVGGFVGVELLAEGLEEGMVVEVVDHGGKVEARVRGRMMGVAVTTATTSSSAATATGTVMSMGRAAGTSTVVALIGGDFSWIRHVALSSHGLRVIALLLFLLVAMMGRAIRTAAAATTASPGIPLFIVSPREGGMSVLRATAMMGWTAKGETKGEDGRCLVVVNPFAGGVAVGIEGVDKVPEVGSLIVSHDDRLVEESEVW